MYESEFHITGPLLLDSYLLVVVVLMMNMLIASVLLISSFRTPCPKPTNMPVVRPFALLRTCLPRPSPLCMKVVLATNATFTHHLVG